MSLPDSLVSEIKANAPLVEIATELWGEPNKSYTTRLSMRWGSGGSKALDLQERVWFDHEAQDGGDIFKLVMQATGKDFVGAVEYVAAKAGIRLPEKSHQPSTGGHSEPPPPSSVLPDDDRPPVDAPAAKMVAVKGYHYTDRDGNLLYDVIRYQFILPDGSLEIDPKTGNPRKTFRQRRPDGRGGYIWNLEGIGHTIYRHQQVDIAIAEGKTIYLVEGEKDVETLEEWGLVATTNSGGATHWTEAMAQHLRAADVVIIPDNDEAGRAGAEKKALSLRGVAARVRVLDLAHHVPTLPAKGDITDWRDRMGGDASKLGEFLNTLPDWTPRPPAPKFGARRGRDIAGSKIVYDWLVKGLIERGGVFIVAGEKQAGKSFFVLDLGMKIALGLEYGKGEKARKVKQGAVIYLACEDRKGVDMRYEGWRRDNQVPPEQDVPFVVMGGPDGERFSLLSDESVDAFIAYCLEWKAFYGSLEMIVIDTFSVATEGLDEIHSGEVGKVLGRVNRIAEKTASAVCLVHHMNGEGNRVRGHSSLTANVSQVIEIRNLVRPQQNRRLPPELIKDADSRIIRQAILEKNKNGPNRIAWRFVLRQVKLGVDDDGYEISTCVMDAPSSEPDVGQVKTGRLSPPQKLVYDALQAAIDDHGTPIPQSARAGSSVRLCVDHRHFIDAVRKVMEFRSPDTETEARNKELSDFMARNVMALINGGYMGRDNDLKIVWLTGKEDRQRSQPKLAEKPPPLPDDVREAIAEGVPF